MNDMMTTVISTSDKSNFEVSKIERRNSKMVSEFVNNRNIIYECVGEDIYLEGIKKDISSYYDIRKDVASQYKINDAHNDFECWYQRKVLFLTWVIPKSMFLTWIYTDLKSVCNHFIVALIAYKDIKHKLDLLKVDEQLANVKSELPLKMNIDAALLSNGILFSIPNLKCEFNYTPLFVCENLKIPSMKWITLRGESGSGKTTLCNLLLRTMPTDNDISLFGVYEKYDYNSIRHLISNVKPNADLFDRNIEFNLKYGVNDKDKIALNDKIKHYLILFGLDNLVDRLNDHIDDLSTGEKQRIKIIRCILQDKPIWILDEITSNLDKDCEEVVITCLRQIQMEKKKSVIHITHNGDLLKYCDNRIEIDNTRLLLT